MGGVRRALGLAGAAAGAGLVGTAYAVAETRSFVTRHTRIPCLPAGSPELRVLHLSDLHLTPGQRRKQAWIDSLADLRPDLVVNTGDNLAHLDAVGPVLGSLRRLLEVPGVFVFGSNDYYAPVLKNPAMYLAGPSSRKRLRGVPLPSEDLRAGFREAGWVDLTNSRAGLDVGGLRLAFAGVDDPHIGRDRLAAVAGTADPRADLRVGVLHAPYLRVLDAFSRDGYEVLFAGHTHGGQLCLPGRGALVTNCDLEPARAKGLHRHPADSSADQDGSSWLHVSAGAGTSPYAPVRVCCRPEANLVTLAPRAVGAASGTDVRTIAGLG